MSVGLSYINILNTLIKRCLNMALSNQPLNLNALHTIAFETNFAIMPNVNYFCQRVNIPAIAMGLPLQPTPYTDLTWEGDTLTFETLNIGFIVDEDMTNYLEIYNWLLSLGFPEQFAQHEVKKSDMNIIIHTNQSNPNYQIKFKDAFPTSLGEIPFDVGVTSLEPVVVDVTFQYTGAFEVLKLG
tara:strand:- start:132 stop:683 length:552 start_codon:yes stop_codon:yes gene_type:complete